MLERHPALKLIAVHGGGYLASYSGRIDHAWGARTDARGGMPQPPATYLERVFLDSAVFTPHQLHHLIEVFDAGQIVMGTDYPSNPVGHLASARLDEVTFSAIAGKNSQGLFGI